MPKLSKQFHLEITVEQFLNSCSYIELQEIDMCLDVYLKKAEHDSRRGAYRQGKDREEIESLEAEEVDEDIDEDGNQWVPMKGKPKHWSSVNHNLDFDRDF